MMAMAISIATAAIRPPTSQNHCPIRYVNERFVESFLGLYSSESCPGAGYRELESSKSTQPCCGINLLASVDYCSGKLSPRSLSLMYEYGTPFRGMRKLSADIVVD